MGGVVVLISANLEWQALCDLFPDQTKNHSPYGEWFFAEAGTSQALLFFHGGWGKIAAAASTQYAIDRWAPDLLVNLGTCGGFEGHIERGTILLVERTLVYDIFEQMGDFDEHIAHYTTDLDLSWIQAPLPPGIQRSLLISADRDLVADEIPSLMARYGAVAGDWESGAIGFVADRNSTRCLILRAVSDLVSAQGGEAYGNLHVFNTATRLIMERLVTLLPFFLN